MFEIIILEHMIHNELLISSYKKKNKLLVAAWRQIKEDVTFSTLGFM